MINCSKQSYVLYNTYMIIYKITHISYIYIYICIEKNIYHDTRLEICN